MNIVHIAPNAPYNDYWGYQENLLPKYQKKLGHEVTLVITNTAHKDGKIVEVDEADYVLNDGVRVIRRKYKQFISKRITNILSYIPVSELLEELQPDFIFCHGLMSYTITDVIKYVKSYPDCRVVQDTHEDYYNGHNVKNLKSAILRCWYRLLNGISIKHVDKVFGVTPWRGEFAKYYYRIPESKIDLLVMGADDEKIHFDQMPMLRKNIRNALNIRENDFVLISGGKIDESKNIHLLMQAVAELDIDRLKLIVFGTPNEKMKSTIEKLSEDNHICNIGWQAADRIYDYFLASDLAVFPGTHSVLWEQACGCGLPVVVKDWEGMHHVDLGGNCVFLNQDSVEEMKEVLLHVFKNPDVYKKMKRIAEEKGIPTFSYSQIARRAIGLENEASAK